METSQHRIQFQSAKGKNQEDTRTDVADLMIEREKITADLLAAEPLNLHHYLRRAIVHLELCYPDLAAGDAYRALTLLETHHCNIECSSPVESDEPQDEEGDRGAAGFVPSSEDEQQAVPDDAPRAMAECLECLVLALADLGCLRDAHAYLLQLEDLDSKRQFFEEETHRNLLASILRSRKTLYTKSVGDGDSSDLGGPSLLLIEPSRLPNFGSARREIYRWNKHEPERSSIHTLSDMNSLLERVAPDLEVRAVELPALTCSASSHRTVQGVSDTCQVNSGSTAKLCPTSDKAATSLQLGLFAKTDLAASSTILRETSVLTAIRPLYASICDNCGSNISEPPPSTADAVMTATCCPLCTEAAVFCCPACLEMAQTGYHSTTCGNEDVELLGRDSSSDHPSEDLYFRLLVRAFAVSHTQSLHPLELPEVKYLWGDLNPEQHCSEGLDSVADSSHYDRTNLPFTLQHNIVLPFRLLSILGEEHPDMSPYSAKGLDWYDTWVVQTLYSKFRGVASARQSTWDGKPEVAAVHPLWCLANHSCAPNVEWSWGRERTFKVRDKPVLWGEQRDKRRVQMLQNTWAGIKVGEQIYSHYCDLELPVGERKNYMLGSLGGECKCERCSWEAEQG